MRALILDGRAAAAAVKGEVAAAVSAFERPPGLATVLVGDDPASAVYVRGKRRDAAEVGIASIHRELGADASQAQVEALVGGLSGDDSVDGILVQLPLPGDLDGEAVVQHIDPAKDADGLHPLNLGRLVLGKPGLRPCTPTGIIRMLDHHDIAVSGRRVVVVGRSFLVGRPLVLMLSEKGADATVSIGHSRTEDLAALTREADIVVSAAGRPGLITPEHVRPGATVVDVGANRGPHGLVGDVVFDSVREVAGAITPVPGGVGPMTRAMLLVNTLRAAEARRGR